MIRWSLYLVAAIATLEIAAGLAYLVQGQWKLAGVWICVGLGNVFMTMLDGAQ